MTQQPHRLYTAEPTLTEPHWSTRHGSVHRQSSYQGKALGAPFCDRWIIAWPSRTEGHMPTASVRRVQMKAALRDAEVAAYGQLTPDEVLPALPRVQGVRAAER